MSLFLAVLLLIVGFGAVVKGADFLVDGASAIARRFGVSPLVIGLTIVALGTSMPELIVNLVASVQGNSDIAIGNVVGSNIANIFLILGVSAIIIPLKVSKGTAFREIPLAILAAALLFVLPNDALIDGAGFSQLGRGDAFVLLGYFVIFVYYTFGISRVTGERDLEEPNMIPMRKSWLFILAGAVLLPIGGKLIVDAATTIGLAVGLSEAFIGLTVVAFGTSIPELAASAVAAYKGDPDIAVGNAIGSNIFNVLWVLGLSALISPITYNPAVNFDLLVGVGASVLLFVLLFIGKRRQVERWQGIGLVVCYILYIAIIAIRG